MCKACLRCCRRYNYSSTKHMPSCLGRHAHSETPLLSSAQRTTYASLNTLLSAIRPQTHAILPRRTSRPRNQRDPAVLHDSSRHKPARVSKRHMFEPQAVQDAQTSCRLLCGHSPSAISWRGSISRCFSSTSTPLPLDAPGGKTSSMSGRAWLMNENKMHSGSCL